MGDSCVAGAVCGATGSGARIYPYCLYWLFGAHSLWRDTLLSLDIEGRTLVLPQSDIQYFVDSPWEALPSWRRGWGVRGKESGGDRKRGGSGNWDLVCKIKKDSLFSF